MYSRRMGIPAYLAQHMVSAGVVKGYSADFSCQLQHVTLFRAFFKVTDTWNMKDIFLQMF